MAVKNLRDRRFEAHSEVPPFCFGLCVAYWVLGRATGSPLLGSAVRICWRLGKSPRGAWSCARRTPYLSSATRIRRHAVASRKNAIFLEYVPDGRNVVMRRANAMFFEHLSNKNDAKSVLSPYGGRCVAAVVRDRERKTFLARVPLATRHRVTTSGLTPVQRCRLRGFLVLLAP